MGRGKIEMKYIENTTNRQVTYSKRKSGILKKARELTILCDAQVCLLMFSSTGKLTQYLSPSTTLKEVFDKYQRETYIDLWAEQHEALQEELKAQKEINDGLKKEIRQRTGQDDLSEFSIKELRSLEQNLEKSLVIVRDRKNQVLTNQTHTFTKKVKCLEEARKRLLHSLYANKEEQESVYYAVPADNDGVYYPEFVQKEGQEFFCAVPANINEGDQQPDYGSTSSSIGSLSTDGGGGDWESSEITFQQLQPSHINFHNEAGGAYSFNPTFA